jgi:holo-[acyl-carrier protein] synthase
MIVGIGTDIVEVDRIAAVLERQGDRFAQRILGPDELQRFDHRRKRSAARGVAYLSTRWAAKEALSKALGLGMRSPMSWRAAQILNMPSGQPCIVANGALHTFLESKRWRLHVTMSDEHRFAVAFVIAELHD